MAQQQQQQQMVLVQLLRHPYTQAIQVQASLILCVGILGWTLSGVRRRREALRLQAAGYSQVVLQQQQQQRAAEQRKGAGGQVHEGTEDQQQQRCSDVCSFSRQSNGNNSSRLFKSSHYASTSSTSTSSPCCWPPLAVVLPVKGCRPHGTDNWRSQITTHYDGPSVFIFVVESATDPAAAAVAALMQQQQGAVIMTPLCKKQQQQEQQQCWPPCVLSVWQQQQQNKQQQCPADRLVVLSEAGLASTCSQKIHNILNGIDVAVPLLERWQQQQEQQQQEKQRSHCQQSHAQCCECHCGSSSGSGSSDGGGGCRQQWEASTPTPPAAGGVSSSSSSRGNLVQIHAVASGGRAAGDTAAASTADDDGCCFCCCHQEHTREAAAAAADVFPSQAPLACAAASSAPAAAAASSAVRDCSSGYVCVLDDDVLLHPLGLMQLVDELEADPSLFMATGYPFDIVADSDSSSSSGSSSSSSVFGRLLSYAAASYHLPLTIGFSTADRGPFVWGGAMMIRGAAALSTADQQQQQQQQQPAALPQHQQMKPQHQHQQQQVALSAVAPPPAPAPPPPITSLLEVWREGGYSDDLLAAAYCVDQDLTIALPAAALYPQLLPPTISFKQYWNYLRRQLFVLDTYYNSSNRTTNHIMMGLHSYGSAVFTAAVAATALQLLLLAAVVAGCCCCWLGAAISHHAAATAAGAAAQPAWWWNVFGEAAGVLVGVGGQLAGLLAAGEFTCTTNPQPPLTADANSSTSTTQLFDYSSFTSVLRAATSSVVSPGLCVFVLVLSLAYSSVVFMAHQCLLLFRVLSPQAGRQLLWPRMSLLMLWAGWVFENALLPVCMAYTYCCDSIVWGGIRYIKGGGRVVQVIHPPPAAAPAGAATKTTGTSPAAVLD